MAEKNLPADAFRQLSDRLKHIEETLQQQISRIYAIEQRLGISPEPVSIETIPPPITTLLIESQPIPPQSVAPSMSPSVIDPEVKGPEAVGAKPSPAVSSKWFSLEGKDLEALIGGNWFSRIGILAIILSVGFFLKYAFENQWIGPAGRVMIGVALGIGFLFGGERLRAQGYQHYAHGLSGGGIAILYLAFFAAFSRYQLIGQMPAFVLMSLVTVTAVLLAARYDALAIAILGLIGGFLTPILLSTGIDNQVRLFSYITLLDLGVLALAYFKKWRVLNYLAYLATVLMSIMWVFEWYAPEKLWTTIFFFTLLFALFALLSILYNVINRDPVEWPEIYLILLNAGLYFGSSYTLLEPQHHSYLGLFAVLLSAFYRGLGYLTYSRDREDRYLILTFLGLALIFLTLAIPIQMNQQWVTMAWALEGLVLTWIGLRTESRLTRYAALLVFIIAGLHWLVIDLSEIAFPMQADFVPLINRRGASCMALISCLAGAVWLYPRYGETVEERERRVFVGSLALAANALAILWLSLDLRDYFEFKKAEVPLRVRSNEVPWQREVTLDSLKHLLLTLLWCAYGVALLLIGLAKRLKLLRWAALILLGLASFKVLFFDTRYYAVPWRTLIFNPVFGSFAVLVVALAYGCWRYSRTNGIEAEERGYVLPVLLLAANLLAVVALSVESESHFLAAMRPLEYGSEAWRDTQLARQLWLSVIWAVYSGAMLIVGIWRRNRLLRLMALFLLGLTIFKVFLIDLSALDKIYRVISFVVLGVILLVVSFLYQRSQQRIAGGSVQYRDREGAD